jgi:hypothetical protein
MVGHYDSETIANWAADFANDDAVRLFPAAVQSVAAEVLTIFLAAACQVRGCDLNTVVDADIKVALLEHVAVKSYPPEVHPFIPSLCRVYLSDLQTRGRLGNGAALGRFAGALKAAYADASRLRPETFTRPGEKIGRNDLCPCGSGKKFKKCCNRT